MSMSPLWVRNRLNFIPVALKQSIGNIKGPFGVSAHFFWLNLCTIKKHTERKDIIKNKRLLKVYIYNK